MRKRIVVKSSDHTLSNTIFDNAKSDIQNTIGKFKPNMNIGINPETRELMNGLLTGQTKLPTIYVGLEPDTRTMIDTGIKMLSGSIALVGLLSLIKSKKQP